jgi:hypothetical protein
MTQDLQFPEGRALKDNLTSYLRSSAEKRIANDVARQKLDHLVVTWRDTIHESMQTPGDIQIRLLHNVMDNMDLFLNRQKNDSK